MPTFELYKVDAEQNLASTGHRLEFASVDPSKEQVMKAIFEKYGYGAQYLSYFSIKKSKDIDVHYGSLSNNHWWTLKKID